MNVDIKFRKTHGDYSQEYADFHENRKESISNPKHSPVWVLKLTDIEEITLEPCQNHTVTGVDPVGVEKTITQYFDIKADTQIMELWNGFYVNVDELPNELQ